MLLNSRVNEQKKKKLANTNIPVKLDQIEKERRRKNNKNRTAIKNSFIIVSLCQFDIQRIKTKTLTQKKVITWKDCCKQY